MKKFVLLLTLVCASSMVFAQTSENTPIKEENKVRKVAIFKKGDLHVNAGVGLIPTYAIDKNTTALMPPLSLSVAYRLGNSFMLGAFMGKTKSESYLPEQRDGTNWYVNNSSTIIGLRSEFHAARRNNLDIYGGFMFAYDLPKVERTLLSETGHGDEVIERNIPVEDYTGPKPFSNDNPNKGKALFTGFVGAAYYLTPHINIFGEVGYGVSIATFGLGYKFGI